MAQKQAFRITDFRGGLNPDQNAHQIADNEAASIKNFRLDQDGSLVSRNGYDHYLSLTAANDILTIGRWSDGKIDPTAEVLGMDDAGNLLRWNAVGPALDTILATGTARTKRGEFVPVTDKVIYCDGEDTPIWYNGTTAAPLGLAAPSAAPALTAINSGTGALSGTYQYVYTYYDTGEGWESNPSDSASVSPVDADVTVDVVASTDTGVDQISIYRTVAGGSIFLFLGTTTNTTGTYTDDGTDTLIALAVDYRNTPPLDYERMAYHKGYMFGAIGNTLYWSNSLNIHGWPSFNSTDIPFEGNDEIVALVSHQDTLVIFGTKNIITVAGAGGNWTLIRQDVSLGALSHTAVTEVMGQLLFLSHDGLYLFPQMQKFAPKLARSIATTAEIGHSSASLVYISEQNAVWLSLNNQTWVITLPSQAISLYNFYMYYPLQGGTDEFEFPIWVGAENYTDTSRLILMQYGGYDDDGSDILISWKSKIFQLANPEFTKFFRRIGAFATSGATATVTITINDQANPPYTVALASAGETENPSVYGTAVFGTDSWSFEGLSYLIAALPAVQLHGRTFQISINGSVSSRTELIPPVTFQYREANRFLGL